MNFKSSAQSQRGVFLLEAMIGILIFSLGILALMGLQAVSIKNTVESKNRSDASYLANQLIARMWTDIPNIASYNTASPSSATTAVRDQWLADVANTLPGVADNAPTVVVNTAADPMGGARPPIHTVTVTLSWKTPGRPEPHSFSTTTRIVAP